MSGFALYVVVESTLTIEENRNEHVSSLSNEDDVLLRRMVEAGVIKVRNTKILSSRSAFGVFSGRCSTPWCLIISLTTIIYRLLVAIELAAPKF